MSCEAVSPYFKQMFFDNWAHPVRFLVYKAGSFITGINGAIPDRTMLGLLTMGLTSGGCCN